MPEAWLAEYLQPGRRLTEVGPGILSGVAPTAPSSGYDGHARSYDRLVGNRFYNRLVWGIPVASYEAFAAAAVADSNGPLLDVGCGTAVFSAESYRRTDRPLVLVDRSMDMLIRAAERLQGAHTRRIVFVQADMFDLPFRTEAFATVACHGLLHLFEKPDQVLRVLRAQIAADGSLYATSLVAETRIGTTWLRLLHRIGEAAVPRRHDDLLALARITLGGDVDFRCEGSMVFLHSH
ncbi:MAG: class I SAM-dependent methyltransferase [Ornithinimicrobium sp.]